MTASDDMRSQVLAALERCKPVQVAMVDESGTVEWLAVPRGKGRWERLINHTIGGRAWVELRLCDGRKSTLEVLRVGADVDTGDDPDVDEPVRSGDREVQFAKLLADTVKVAVRTVCDGFERTVRTMRTESRGEVADLLTAHQDMARDAFSQRGEALNELGRVQGELAAVSAELVQLRAQVAHQSAPDPQQAAAEQREATLLQLMTGGKGNGGGDPSQGMPSGT